MDSLKIAIQENMIISAVPCIAGDYALIGADGHGYDENGANYLMTAGAAFYLKESPITMDTDSEVCTCGSCGRRSIWKAPRYRSEWFSVAHSAKMVVLDF